MNEIIIIGGGGHASSCIDVIEESKEFIISGIIDNNLENTYIMGYDIIGDDSSLERLRNKYEYALIAIGQIKSPKTRIEIFEKLKRLHYKLPVIISPRAHVSKYSQIKEGTIVMHDAIINAKSKVGSNCIINNKALVEHDAQIGNNCHISTGAIVNGCVTIGSNTFIGSGVVTKQNIEIGSNCIIGAGKTISNDIKSDELIKN